MSFYYIEVNKKGKIISYGESVGADQALLKTEGAIMEITEKEYKLVSACKGNIISGISALMFLGHRIDGKRENGDFDLLS